MYLEPESNWVKQDLELNMELYQKDKNTFFGQKTLSY